MATLDGITLPAALHEQIQHEINTANQYRIGVAQTLTTNAPASRIIYGWRLRFRLLTTAQRDSVRALYTKKADMNYTPENVTGGPYIVQVEHGSWQQEVVNLGSVGGMRYSVGFNLIEV